MLGEIDEEIGLVTSAYVKRLLEQAVAINARAVAIELNTFGGRVDAAVAIRDALLDAPMQTIVFINKRAISAGALISLACEKIAMSSGGTIGAATPVMMGPGQQVPEAVGEKYLSYFRQEMRVTAEANGRNGDIAAAMVDASIEVPGVSEAGKLLTLTTEEALEHKMADVRAASMAEVLKAFDLGNAPTERLERTWSESLVGFLTRQEIASILFLVMVVFGYLEYQAPGFGLFGWVALVCFFLLFFSHYLVNLAGWEEVMLFALGVVLLIIELFVTPGFGVFGILGAIAVFASLALLFIPGNLENFSFDNPFTVSAIFRVLLTTAGAIVALFLLGRYLPKEPGTHRLVLGARMDKDAGYTSHEEQPEYAGLVGSEGVALTPLRPSGRARIGNKRLGVESEGEFIEKGEPVRVSRVEPGRIVVQRA